MVGLDNPIHIAVLLILLLLVFGAKRLPEMGKSLGSGLRGFRESLSGETTDTESSPSTPSLTAASAPVATEPEHADKVPARPAA